MRSARRVCDLEIAGRGDDDTAFDLDGVAAAAARSADDAGAKTGEVHAIAR
jgi:hypothetical protein